MTNRISISAVTDAGKEREGNEDAFIFRPDLSQRQTHEGGSQSTGGFADMGPWGSVIIVADGMGGANAGEVASDIATHSVMAFLSDSRKEEPGTSPADTGKAVQTLKDAIAKAEADINAYVCAHPETCGMGTTIVTAWIIGGKALVAWCGDSRCYVYNPSEGLRRLTKDHSLVQQMVDRGDITEEEAFSHPDNNIITKGLGDFDTAAAADTVVHTLSPSDMLLLCSDGLCGYCTDADMGRTLAKGYPDTNACRDALLRMALDAGGCDNICIAVAATDGAEAGSPTRTSLLRRLKNVFCD